MRTIYEGFNIVIEHVDETDTLQWKIVEGEHGYIDYGYASTEDEAEELAKEVINRIKFL